MIENKTETEENFDIPLEGEGWFEKEKLPNDIRDSYKYPIYYRYTDDDSVVTKDAVAWSATKPNIGPLVNEGYSVNIFIRDDLSNEHKKIAFLHELYDGYYEHSLGMDHEEAHKKASEKYSIDFK
jgi:hypothetical protein